MTLLLKNSSLPIVLDYTKNTTMNRFYVILMLFCFPIFMSAQTFIVGGGVGFSNYQGDIASDKIWSPEEFNLGINAFMKFNFGSQWALRGNFLYTTLSGNDSNYFDTDPWRMRRDYSFETSIQEITVILEWRFLDKHIRRKGFHPYIFVGKGFTSANTNGALLNSTDDPTPRKTSNLYSSLPLGGGFYYDLNERVTIGMEISSRVPFTDNLDGLSPRGFSEGNDWYTYSGLTVGYEFGKDWDVEKLSSYNKY